MTIRLAEVSVVSDDLGETRVLPIETAEIIENLVSADFAVAPPASGSAAQLATLGELRNITYAEEGYRQPTSMPWATGRPTAIGDRMHENSNSFANVLERRVSDRRVSRPIDLETVATLLVRSGRVREFGEVAQGVQWTRRPAPSAGGRHPCSMVLAARGIRTLPSGLWLFEPTACELLPLVNGSIFQVDRAIALRGIDDWAAAVIVVADFSRTVTRYPNGASLVWQDSGALLGLLHLVATDLGLPSCILSASNVIGDAMKPAIDLGLVLVGGAEP